MLAPLAAGAAAGHLLVGLTIAIGALNVAFSDGEDAYRTRAARMLAATLLSGVSVFAGAATASIGVLAVLTAAVWSFATGMLVLLGSTPAQLGLTTLILLLVFSAEPMPPDRALATAGLVCVGGVLQTLLAISPWPARGFAPERRALERASRAVAAWASAPARADQGLPGTKEMSAASEALTATRSDHGPIAEALVSVLNQVERMRLGLVSLDEITRRLASDPLGEPAASAVRDIFHATADGLLAIADSLADGAMPGKAGDALARVDTALHALQVSAAGSASNVRWLVDSAVLRAQALRGQLRAALEMSARARGGASLESFRIEAELPPELRPYGAWRRIRANLTLRSAAFRHAARLVTCIMIAEALAVVLRVPHGYWIPMTVAIVLKPDFTATFSRGIARLAGTLAGLLAASLVLHIVPGSTPYYVALAGALTFAVRGVGRANYAILVVSVTGLIVVLLALGGAPALPSMEARGVATLVGGALALAAYAAWPTWERSQTPLVLAEMLDAYRTYFQAVIDSVDDSRSASDSRLSDARLRARLARSNAEASVDRLFAEPRGSVQERSLALRLLASSRQFTRAAMVLEAGTHDPSFPRSWPVEFSAFAKDVGVTLVALASALRGRRAALESLPDLRAEQVGLRDAVNEVERVSGEQAPPPSSVTLALDQTDRMTNAVNTMVTLLM